MSATTIDPEKLVARLSQQIGQMAAEIAMRDVALEAAHAEIEQLKGAQAEGAGDGV